MDLKYPEYTEHDADEFEILDLREQGKAWHATRKRRPTMAVQPIPTVDILGFEVSAINMDMALSETTPLKKITQWGATRFDQLCRGGLLSWDGRVRLVGRLAPLGMSPGRSTPQEGWPGRQG